jgi:immune inhibitor A
MVDLDNHARELARFARLGPAAEHAGEVRARPIPYTSEEHVTRKIAGLASLATVVATLGLATTAVSGSAHADPSPSNLPSAKGEPQVKAKADNRPDPMSKKQADLRQRAVDDLVSGDAQLVGKGEDRAIQLANGDQVEYPASQSAELLTFLVQFGADDYGHAYTGNTAGPLHNTIDVPAANDNSTYYLPNFDRQHYMDMFFNGLADQGGESFKSVYKEESSGRFDLKGDVSDWVTVPNAASYYQSPDGAGDEDGQSMYNFLKDGATAWYDDQKAAGKTDAQITDYLKQFDVWDRFDYDHDGNYNEPDGYIDHFQAIHAGEDESAGAPTWAIWAHRSSTNINADVGPTGNHNGGVQIGNSGLWIRDYTTEPENGGLGVFAHEFGHDLGLPDYYDTGGGDNSTGFWTLMSQGSWNSHGDASGNIGTTPNHIGAPDKMFLGWYGANDLAIVDGTGAPQNVNLGPSYHATTEGAQAVAVTLPQGSATVNVVAPEGPGTHYFYSGTGDDRDATLTSPDVQVPNATPTLTARVSYDLEEDYDYGYFEVSTDGGTTWTHVNTSKSTTDDPNQANAGFGITNCSGAGTGGGTCTPSWVDLSADLTAYAGQTVKLRFETVNDPATHGLGLSVDNIKLGGTTLTDVEGDVSNWVLDGWRVMNGSSYTLVYDRYYMAENKQRFGYEKTLFQGPYSFDYPVSAPSAKVDHFSYQDGLLVWYVNGLYADNNTSAHPGGGEAIPVDSNPKYSLWTQGGVPKFYASGNLNAYDATFDVDQADGLHLTNENGGGVNFDVDAHPSVPVFDDTNPNAYWDNTYPTRSSWYSTKVAGVGSMIQVMSSDETTGKMVIKAGQAFVAAVGGAAAINGTPAVGQTLTAVAPTFFGTGVTTSYKWMIDGKLVWGASTYQVKPEDAGKKIDLVVTGSKTGYLPFTQTVSVNVPKNAAPTATKAVAVTGSPVVGQTLTATPATWPVDGTSTFAWKAGGATVGTGSSYQLKPADTGKTVTVTETRSSTAQADGTSTSTATAAVAPATTSLAVVAPKKVKKGKSVTVKVTLSAANVTPTGTVKVSIGGKEVTGQLVNGTVTVKLAKQHKAGKKTVTVTYVPDTGFTASSTTVKVKITKH